MPKIKTHSGAKKRFKITGSGKITRRHAFCSHLLEKKSEKTKRKYEVPASMANGDKKTVKKLLNI